MTDFNNGSVKVSHNIIEQLIAETALQVEGVKNVIGYKGNKIEKNKKDGVVAVVDNNNIKIALSVALEGMKDIYTTTEKIQKSITEQIHTMLGFDVKEVNVFIKSV